MGPNDGQPKDPGWGQVLRRVPLSLVFLPLGLLRIMQRKGTEPPILVLREMFIVFLFAQVLILYVLPLLLPLRAPDPAPMAPVIALVVCGTVMTAVGAQLARRSPLPCVDESKLQGAYTNRLFLAIAAAQTAAFAGILASFLSGGFWPYLIGLTVSAGGFLVITPTHRDVLRRQRQLTSQDCRASLLRALYTPQSQGTSQELGPPSA